MFGLIQSIDNEGHVLSEKKSQNLKLWKENYTNKKIIFDREDFINNATVLHKRMTELKHYKV